MKPITDFLGIKQGIKMNILTILILNQNNVDQKKTLTGWPLGIYRLEENLKLLTNFTEYTDHIQTTYRRKSFIK